MTRVLYCALATDEEGSLYERPDFVRLAGFAVNGGPVTLTTDISALVRELHSADLVVMHNGMLSGLAALHMWHGLDVWGLLNGNRIRDTEVLARQLFPPKSPGAPESYELDHLCRKVGLPGALRHGRIPMMAYLKNRFGGLDLIPVDQRDYRDHLSQLVEMTRSFALGIKMPPADLEYCFREMRYLQLLTAMPFHGVRGDVVELARQDARLEQRRRDIYGELHERWGFEKLGEVGKSGKVVKAPLGTDAGKVLLRGILASYGVALRPNKKGNPDTSKEALAFYVDDHDWNDELREFCELVTIARGDRKPPSAYLRPDGKFRPLVSPSQRTGRISLTQPGLTVLGKNRRKDALDRAVCLPDTDDHVFLCVDMAQVDARAIAAVSGDPVYRAAFEGDNDQHTVMAQLLFNDPSKRSKAKVFTHAINYGMGARSMSKQTGLPQLEVDGLLAKMHREFPTLFAARHAASSRVDGVIVTPFGRRVGFAADRAYTQAFASLGQATARDLLVEGLFRLDRDIIAMLRVSVHDELVFSVPEARYEEIKQRVLKALTFSFSAGGNPAVPIRASAASPGRDWAECYAAEHPDWPEMSRAWREAHPAWDGTFEHADALAAQEALLPV